jgi:hypothetical protein
VEPLNDDTVRLNRAREWRPAGPKRGGAAPGGDRSTGDGWEPNPPFGYVVSFIRHHERGFTVPASRFMRELCHHYGVELHNFAPNAIS